MDWLISILGSGLTVAAVTGILKIMDTRIVHKAGAAKDRWAAVERKIDSNTEGIGRNTDSIGALKEALRVILHDRLKHLAQEHIAAGAITYGDRGDLMDMHRIYHDALGGNGNLAALMEALLNLPLSD